jgi:predicted ribosomally synthesized peptide with nif11-like leader
MSEDQLKAFREVVRADAVLQGKLKAAADIDAVVAIAKAAGFMISTESLQNSGAQELSDEELETVAGGRESVNHCGWDPYGQSVGDCDLW